MLIVWVATDAAVETAQAMQVDSLSVTAEVDIGLNKSAKGLRVCYAFIRWVKCGWYPAFPPHFAHCHTRIPADPNFTQNPMCRQKTPSDSVLCPWEPENLMLCETLEELVGQSVWQTVPVTISIWSCICAAVSMRQAGISQCHSYTWRMQQSTSSDVLNCKIVNAFFRQCVAARTRS